VIEEKDLDYQTVLTQGLKQLQIDVEKQSLLNYLDLLAKWNNTYNLTAITSKKEMVTKHLLDSLAIIPYLKGPRIIDVGSGAGLPGIPIAMAKSEYRVFLLDSNGKKIRFLQHIVRQLKLDNVEIVQSRAENYHPSTGFDTVVTRAFSNINQMITWTQHLILAKGRWLAMKGRMPKEELNGLNYSHQIKRLCIPGLEDERCCVLIEDDNHG
jgi:16S rRNA (guanine527-N7)-methyltransferase